MNSNPAQPRQGCFSYAVPRRGAAAAQQSWLKPTAKDTTERCKIEFIYLIYSPCCRHEKPTGSNPKVSNSDGCGRGKRSGGGRGGCSPGWLPNLPRRAPGAAAKQRAHGHGVALALCPSATLFPVSQRQRENASRKAQLSSVNLGRLLRCRRVQPGFGAAARLGSPQDVPRPRLQQRMKPPGLTRVPIPCTVAGVTLGVCLECLGGQNQAPERQLPGLSGHSFTV